MEQTAAVQALLLTSKIERQIQLETDAVSNGCVRWAQSAEYQQATDTKPYRNMIAIAWKSFSEAILAEQELVKLQKTKLPPWAVHFLSVGHEQLALIALDTLFNMIAQSEFETLLPPRTTPVAAEIGQRCRVERLHDIANHRQIDVEEALHGRNQTRKASKRAAELAALLADADDWSINHRGLHLGHKLISLALQKAVFEGKPIFVLMEEQENHGKGIKTMHRIGFSEAAETWIAEHTAEVLQLITPLYVPMICEPRPWTSLTEGGYMRTPMTLLKRQTGKRAQRRLEKANLSPVFDAVNALQNTAFRVNEPLYRLQRDAWFLKLPFFGVTSDAQVKGVQKTTAFRFGQAVQLSIDETFYFPYQVDHRGRVYAVPQQMNPQSDHIGRALIEFADGKRLGKRGARWLAIHLFNCFWKGKKLSFDERRAWVKENEQELLDFAANPLRLHRFWLEADHPWLFVAACVEWLRYKKEGPNMISHLPVSMDGSCNGYQHLSAMGLDPFGGRATNLMALDKPEDIYQWVSDLVCRRMEMEIIDFGPDARLARQLLEVMSRELAKNATMTTPFGVTQHTIYEALCEKDAIKGLKDPAGCAAYLAKLLVECIPQIAVEAGRIMDWLRDVAGIIARKNRGMSWTTPVGFVVVHENRLPKEERVTTADHKIAVYVQDEKQKIDVRKQEDGIVAHLVHSMDAAHMMRTINRLYAAGLRHFAMVHDSYGVHACDVDLLNRVLREEFVQMYSEPVLQHFIAEQRKAHPGITLPDPPKTGDLDIRQVLDSLYFFA